MNARRLGILLAVLFVGGGEGLVMGASAARPLDFLYNARVAKWEYSRDITPAQAADYATSVAQSGINLLLTEGHRSLVNDWPSTAGEIARIARDGGAEASVRATRIVVHACHARGIRVMHHVTSTFCTKPYLDAHPDWAQRDARTGEPVFFNLYGGLWMLCPNNPDFRADYFRCVADFTRRTGVDGWMVDEVELLPNWYSCGCGHCRARFKAETGFALPVGRDSPVWENFDDPTWRAWLRFRTKTCGNFFTDLKAAIDAAAPNQVFTGCVAGASEIFLPQYWGMDAAQLGRAANFPFYEAWCPKGSPYYSWRRFMAEMLLYGAIARPHGTPALTLYYPAAVAEMPICWALCNVAGSRYWTHNRGEPGFAPYESDGRPAGFFAWERDQHGVFGPQHELASIALLFSAQTRDATFAADSKTLDHYSNTPRNQVGGRDMSPYVNEWAGWAETLVEANAAFAIIRDEELTPDGLHGYNTLIIPDARCLSDRQAQTVLSFAKGGGRLITSGAPASQTETGAPRPSGELSNQIRTAGTHLNGLPGQSSLLGYVFGGVQYRDDRDTAALAAIRAAVPPEPSSPWAIDAPTGVVGRAYKLNDGGAVNFHLLNLTGGRDDAGTTLPEARAIQPSFPPLSGIQVRLRADLAPPHPVAHWISPDGATIPVKLQHQEVCWAATLPELRHYGILHITSANLDDLKPPRGREPRKSILWEAF
ncbi:MAG: hypothetical protein K1X53_07240 [Candidatus Sumerlaeaceae bacterium]|nr:hypothetical protein [Candidatus Sumerlaeaceae bacterium]